ncbi:sensor histidine kinase [Cryobacterium melibiosiphilum]|nr:HAMP domain-containing sensor histidine kinase [Cryobacterium melibiosiphilum]
MSTVPGTRLLEFQLIVAVPLVVTGCTVLALHASELNVGLYLSGLCIVALVTLALLRVRRTTRLLRFAVVIPLADIVGIRLMVTSEGLGPLGDGQLVLLPLLWLAFSFGLRAALGGGLLVAALTPAATYAGFATLDAAGTTRTVTYPLLVAILMTAAWASGRRIRRDRATLAAQSALTRAALQKAEQSSTLLSEIINAVDFGVIAFDRQGSVTLTNRVSQANWPTLDATATPSTPMPGFLQTDGVTPFPRADSPFVRSRNGEAFDGVLGWAGSSADTPVAFSATSRTMDAADTRDRGTVLLLRNVTRELSAMRARDDLISMVTHELRTPLTAIIGNAELVLRDNDQPATVVRRSTVILRGGERMESILSDLLEARSTSSALLPLVPAEFDLRQMVMDAIASNRAAADVRAITVWLTEGPPVLAVADPHRVRQVIDNLLTNATKYNRVGGTVTIAASVVGDFVALAVADTGTGVREADRAQIFDLHFRSPAAQTGVASGLGLGLSISRDIARRHGGDLIFIADEASASLFRLTLPVRPRP